MQTEPRIAAPRGSEPEKPRPPAVPLGDASGYPPNCAHGMSSFTDERYDLALARGRRG